MAKTIKQQLAEVNEYEREPVPTSALKSSKSFLGMYAGEHTAGTEYVIGPLFVAHGVSAADLVGGLIVGNVLAVLSWAFLCAPIATKLRVTLYYQLEKICGLNLTRIYNLVNGLMFCFLAGSMIAVSATAIGIPFNFPMPKLTDMYPTSVGWVVTVFAVGAVITLVAILGYERIARFANVAAPWMVAVFLASAIAVLPEIGVSSLGDFWRVSSDVIWTGIPQEGQDKFTFWHVMFFAWFCNMAMHIGMADMSILRYARKWTYGFTSAAGMFVGHFLAWMASGILYAVYLQQNSGEFAPGPISFYAAGFAGAACVVIAGWTTANPTIYRAGLAIQAMMPQTTTWKVTLVVGLVTTIAACFPALVMKLLDFVALYGLILMPMGAIIFADFYLSGKLGFTSNYALRAGTGFNIAAALTWLLSLAFCLGLNIFAGVEIFFLGLPGWFVAIIFYGVLSRLLQQKSLTPLKV
jgi:purine-cytosine permease-like protein